MSPTFLLLLYIVIASLKSALLTSFWTNKPRKPQTLDLMQTNKRDSHTPITKKNGKKDKRHTTNDLIPKNTKTTHTHVHIHIHTSVLFIFKRPNRESGKSRRKTWNKCSQRMMWRAARAMWKRSIQKLFGHSRKSVDDLCSALCVFVSFFRGVYSTSTYVFDVKRCIAIYSCHFLYLLLLLFFLFLLVLWITQMNELHLMELKINISKHTQWVCVYVYVCIER